jgi:hypothetical protein
LLWFGEDMCISIREVAFGSEQFYIFMQFTHQVDFWIYFMHTVLIRSLCFNYVIINCKCHDSICNDVIESVSRLCRNEVQYGWHSPWYLKPEFSEFKDFFQRMDWVSMCFDHTNSTLRRYVQPVIRPEVSNAFCGFAGRLFGRKQNCDKRSVASARSLFVCLSVCLSFRIKHLFPEREVLDEAIYLWICWKSL